MSKFHVTAHLSNDFSRTQDIAYGFAANDSYDRAWNDGVYGTSVSFTVDDASHTHAAETVWAICNSYPASEHDGTLYPEEMFCSDEYTDIVAIYRSEGLRSFSMGDIVTIRNLDFASDPADGRYVAVRVGFEFLDATPARINSALVTPEFTHQLDGLPAAILPDAPDAKGRVNVWMAGDTYRVSLPMLRPLSW